MAYTTLFAFGDSLSDAGNDWIVDGHTDPVARLTFIGQGFALNLHTTHRKFLIGANDKDLSQSAAARLVGNVQRRRSPA